MRCFALLYFSFIKISGKHTVYDHKDQINPNRDRDHQKQFRDRQILQQCVQITKCIESCQDRIPDCNPQDGDQCIQTCIIFLIIRLILRSSFACFFSYADIFAISLILFLSNIFSLRLFFSTVTHPV